jgi:hypothetical protein
MKPATQPVTHTPGPWTLETVRTSVGVCHQIGALGSSTKIKSACLYDDCYSDQPRDLQLLADARLIAAAPELLEAAKSATSALRVALMQSLDVMLYDSEQEWKAAINNHPTLKALNAAIAKATRAEGTQGEQR